VTGRFVVLLACRATQAVLSATRADADDAVPASAPEEASRLRQVASPTPTLRRLRRRGLYCKPPSFCCPGPPVYGYDGGFYVRDRRSRFTLRPSAYTQLRWTLNERTSAPPGEEGETQDVEFARTRIRFQGDLTPLFDYDFRLSVDHTGDVGVLVASLQWNVNKRWSVKAGQFALAVQREDWAVAEDLLTTEYSANDLVFAPGFAQGVQVSWQGNCNRAWGAFSDGEFRGGNHLLGQTGNAEWAFTGRYEHQFLTRDWSLWDDLVGRRGRGTGLLVGLGGAVGQGNSDVDVDEAYLLTADVSANWNGGQALVFGNFSHKEFKDGTSADTYGFVAQAGHFVTCTSQFYGRYELVSPGSTSGDLATYQSLTAGLNYYPFRWTNRYKLSAEFSYLFSPLSRTIVPAGGVLGFLPSDEDQFYVRLQLQFGF
jgi:hypothetical protein